MLKIKQLRGENVLVSVLNRNATKKIKGTEFEVKNENIAFPTATIVAVGHQCSDDLQVGQKVLVFAQALGMNIDNEDLPYASDATKDKVLYFTIFQSQVEAILEEDTVELERGENQV